jgi:hypothetical protein
MYRSNNTDTIEYMSMTLCSLLRVKWYLERTYCLHLQDGSISSACFMVIYCLLYFSTCMMEATCSPKRLVHFHRIHIIMAQKTEFFTSLKIIPHDGNCRLLPSEMWHHVVWYRIINISAESWQQSTMLHNISHRTVPSCPPLVQMNLYYYERNDCDNCVWREMSCMSFIYIGISYMCTHIYRNWKEGVEICV